MLRCRSLAKAATHSEPRPREEGEVLINLMNTVEIRIHPNVGYGHRKAIRRDSCPLSWGERCAARNVDSDIWEFEIERILSS